MGKRFKIKPKSGASFLLIQKAWLHLQGITYSSSVSKEVTLSLSPLWHLDHFGEPHGQISPALANVFIMAHTYYYFIFFLNTFVLKSASLTPNLAALEDNRAAASLA